ncbi:MAG: hypothetical protein CVT98_07105 [Bacteroidetes bacterium HGW-Bacteroidetes-15]|nr:MAG: hypothetical protein CVT98_07105 [Bacteroidetes bacterium HGW-Bacteroidetes-15]
MRLIYKRGKTVKPNKLQFFKKNTMKRLLTTLLFVMFLKLCIAQSISGTYQTEWGEMILQQSGNQVTGTYKHNNGVIKGTLNGRTLVGTWSQSNGKGKVVFEFNDDFSSFTGRWNYNDDEPTKTGWSGKKKLSVNLNLSGTFSTEWGEMYLQQSGNQVTGTYKHNNGVIKGTLNGRTLVGTWSQSNGKGKFKFEFNDDFSAFTGKWDYNDAEPSKDGWNGKKK